jgi:4'-phosphopantetheinyl transferase
LASFAEGPIILTLSDHSVEDFVHGTLVDLSDLPGLDLALGGDEVHLWHASLDLFSAENLEHVLFEDEVIRARRFHFAKDRNHFTVARALLRKLLQSYLRGDDQLHLQYGEMGKPFLAEKDTRPISFNLAHSGGRAIYAFSRNRELGVDLEFIREDMTGDDIAKRFFSERETNTLQAVPAEQRKQAFFNCWTRKEAYIKARGEGLSMPLDSFDVSLAPGETAALLRNHTDDAEVARWEMRAIPVASGFVAALVVEGHDWALKTFELERGTK